jgi:hypothetical protein
MVEAPKAATSHTLCLLPIVRNQEWACNCTRTCGGSTRLEHTVKREENMGTSVALRTFDMDVAGTVGYAGAVCCKRAAAFVVECKW